MKLMKTHLLLLFLPLLILSRSGYTQTVTGTGPKTVTHAADSVQIRQLEAQAAALQHSNPAGAVAIGMQALELAEKTNDHTLIAGAHRTLRQLYSDNNNYSMAVHHGLKMLDEYILLGNQPMIAKSQYQLGASYYNQADFPNALTHYLESAKIYKTLKDTFQEGIVYNAIGNVYTELNDFKNSADFLNRSQQLARQTGDSVGIAILYTDMGILNSHQGKHDEAIALFKKGMNLMILLRDTGNLINSINNLGVTYKKAGRYEEALQSYQQAYHYLLSANPVDSFEIGKMRSNMGIVYAHLRKYEIAESYLQQSLNYAQMHHHLVLIRECYKELYELNKLKGDYRQALDYELLFREASDSLFSEQKSKQLNELQVKYEAEKKDLEILQLNQQNKIKESEVARQKILKNAFIAGFILILVMAVVLFNRYQVQQKTHRELELKNKALQRTMEELKSAQDQLIHSEKMASLGQLTAGIAHEIKNPLNFINNFADISCELLAELKEEQTEESKSAILSDLNQNIKKIGEHGKRADSIVKGMLSHSRVHDATKEPTDINKLCEDFFSLAYHSMRANYPEFNCEMKKFLAPSLPKIPVVQQDISRVLLNLVSNSFYAVNEKSKKFSHNGKSDYHPEVHIITEKKNDCVVIKTYDNGTGIPDEVKEKVFNPFFTTKPAGAGTGLGLSLSFDIIKAHGGSLALSTEPGAFTSFTISLPVNP